MTMVTMLLLIITSMTMTMTRNDSLKPRRAQAVSTHSEVCGHGGGVPGLDGGPEWPRVQPVQVVVQVRLQELVVMAELNTDGIVDEHICLTNTRSNTSTV